MPDPGGPPLGQPFPDRRRPRNVPCVCRWILKRLPAIAGSLPHLKKPCNCELNTTEPTSSAVFPLGKQNLVTQTNLSGVVDLQDLDIDLLSLLDHVLDHLHVFMS